MLYLVQKGLKHFRRKWFFMCLFCKGGGVDAKYFHQIRGFKVILLWVTMHQINKRLNIKPVKTKQNDRCIFFVYFLVISHLAFIWYR